MSSAIRRMSNQVVEAIETLAGRQAEIWKTTIDGAHQQWADVSIGAARTLRDSFATAVNDNLERHFARDQRGRAAAHRSPRVQRRATTPNSSNAARKQHPAGSAKGSKSWPNC